MSFQKGLAVYTGASLVALGVSTFWTVHAAPRSRVSMKRFARHNEQNYRFKGENAGRDFTARKIVVTGQVTNADGTPLRGVPVEYLGIFPDTPDGSSVHSENGGVTDAAGKFSISNLSDKANYRLSFGGYSQFGYGSTWGKSVFPVVAYSNGWMRLKNGETRNIGRVVLFPADAVVSGRIINSNNRPNPYVVVRGKHCDVSVAPNADGTFRLKNIVREPLTLSVYQSDSSHGWNTGPGCPDEVYSGPVRAGDTNAQVVLR